MNTDTLPCPFCGSELAALKSSYSEAKLAYYVLVRCQNCGAQTRAFRTDENPYPTWTTETCRRAIVAWNRRSYETDPADIGRQTIAGDST